METQHLLYQVEQEPQEISHYEALIQAYRRQGDRANEMKWLAARLENWPRQEWPKWLELAQYCRESQEGIESWRALLSAYYYHPASYSWEENKKPPFEEDKKAFFSALEKQRRRFFELTLVAPRVHFQYITGPSCFSESREYLENRLPQLIETHPKAVIFEWSRLRDADTLMMGFLTAAINNLQQKGVSIFLIPPQQRNFQFLFRFFELQALLEKSTVRSEFEAFDQLRKLV